MHPSPTLCSMFRQAWDALKTTVRWWSLIRERRNRMLAAAEQIADELEFDAQSIPQYGGTVSIYDLQQQLLFGSWERHQLDAAAIGRKHPELWQEIRHAHAELKRIQVQGASPIDPERLRDAAERLRNVR